MLALLSSLLTPFLVAGTVERQSIAATLDPSAHTIRYASTLAVKGGGECILALSEHVEIDTITRSGHAVAYRADAAKDGLRRVTLDLGSTGGGSNGGGSEAGESTLILTAHGRFEQDVAAGERPGAIHNFSVDATILPEGVFLSDGSAWHPRPLDGAGRVQPHVIALELAPVADWAFVASGDPVGETPLDQPCWTWASKRAIDGLALVGNRHRLQGLRHETSAGPVEIVMHVSEGNAAKAPMYLEAAKTYLDLYVPLLGAYPYRRFSIVENFFSSGFAYPGFTLLGPQVVGMAPRSLAPGYLDHELLHNWWGNGVYVGATDGNWCEALTSYCANYWRRVADGGADAGRAYRRDVVMKLSTDPEHLDNGPLGTFGSADPAIPGPDRFVGYDKGSFVFSMLGDVMGRAAGEDAAGGKRDPRQPTLWRGLRIFADRHMGKQATWKDIQASCEAALPQRAPGWLEPFFAYWVRGEAKPMTAIEGGELPTDRFARQFPAGTVDRIEDIVDQTRGRCEIDPDFRIYRVLPARHLVPTIAGSTGPGGLRVETEESRPEVSEFVPQLEGDDKGENLLLIGAAAIAKHAELLKRCDDAIVAGAASFRLGDKEWAAATNAVLHTMHHPDRPGRYITIFHANGDAGWSRLRLIRFYSRDTSIVWDGEKVIERRVHEPERWLPLSATSH